MKLTLNPHTQNRRMRHPNSPQNLSSAPPAWRPALKILVCKDGASFSNQQQQHDAIRTEDHKAKPPSPPGSFFEPIHFLVKFTFVLRSAVGQPTGKSLVCGTTAGPIAPDGHNKTQDLYPDDNEQNEVEDRRFFH
ncbi:MAG TPA: hypothetical protein VJO16_06415 [Candidatus Acidoferrum sp.]|nr:hypothetical protein [Candidatus Acidoferrum sp.]